MMTDREIDNLLTDADRAWNVQAVSFAIVQIAKRNGAANLAEIETRLRALNSRIYLVAMPRPLLPPGLGIFDMFGRSFRPDTWVWIVLNGKTEQEAMLEEIHASEESNMLALELCGAAIA